MKRKAPSAIATAGRALAALLDEDPPARTLINRVVQEHYQTIVQLRRQNHSWDAIGERLRQQGLAFSGEALRRAIGRFEKRRFGEVKTIGTLRKRRRSTDPLQHAAPSTLAKKPRSVATG